MRAIWILLAALMLGSAGGYAWSALTAPPAAKPHIPKPKMVAIAPSPEELPEEADREWAAEADGNAQNVQTASLTNVTD